MAVSCCCRLAKALCSEGPGQHPRRDSGPPPAALTSLPEALLRCRGPLKTDERGRRLAWGHLRVTAQKGTGFEVTIDPRQV